MGKIGIGMMVAALLLSGCISVELQSTSDKLVHSKRTGEYFQNAYTGKWWGNGPQHVLDEQLQRDKYSAIDERGICCVAYNQTWGQVLQGIACFGFRTPVYVTWWLEK